MHRSILLSLALLLSAPVLAATGSLSPPERQLLSQRMDALPAGLRAWTLDAARSAEASGFDAGALGQAVRDRLSGQDYSQADVDALVQLVLMQCAEQADEELRSTLEEMQAVNEGKKARRDAARDLEQARMDADRGLRADEAAELQRRPVAQPAIANIARVATPVPRPVPPPEARPEASDSNEDPVSDPSEMLRLRLQAAQDRRAKLAAALSELMEKSSETAAAISANLK